MGTSGSNGRSPRETRKAAPRKGGGRSRSKYPIHFDIPSDLAAIREVQKRILDDVAAHGYNNQSTFAIKLALEESLINAIKHGNKLDTKKRVVVDARVTPAEVEIFIEDQGPGFHRKDVPDPTEEENLDKCSGRGILLIEAYMSEVGWTKGGRRLRMVKRNEEDVLPRR